MAFRCTSVDHPRGKEDALPKRKMTSEQSPFDKLVDQQGTSMWTKDGAGGDETEIVILDYPDTGLTPAWSHYDDVTQARFPEPDDESDVGYNRLLERPAVDGSWRGAFASASPLLLGLSVVALVAAVSGWMWMEHRRQHSSTDSAPSPAPNGPVLDGIYEIASDNQHATINGTSRPFTDVTRYWAFRSLCTSARCVATAAEVLDTNHQLPNYDHDHSVWLWKDGVWSEDPDHNTSPCGNDKRQVTATMVRTLAPKPDGTLRGIETDVSDINSPCAPGEVVKHPITAKRIGDTPKDVVADPADAPPDTGLHVNQYVAIAVPPKATHVYPGSGPTADYAYSIAVSECLEGASGGDCAVVETNVNGCVVAAVDHSGGFATGKGPDIESARRDARAKLPSSYWADGLCSS